MGKLTGQKVNKSNLLNLKRFDEWKRLEQNSLRFKLWIIIQRLKFKSYIYFRRPIKVFYLKLKGKH